MHWTADIVEPPISIPSCTQQGDRERAHEAKLLLKLFARIKSMMAHLIYLGKV